MIRFFKAEVFIFNIDICTLMVYVDLLLNDVLAKLLLLLLPPFSPKVGTPKRRGKQEQFCKYLKLLKLGMLVYYYGT